MAIPAAEIESLHGLIAQACLALLAILLAAVLFRSRPVRAAFSGLGLFWNNLSILGRVAGVLAIAVFAVFGGAKTKAMRPELLLSSVPPARHGGTVSSNDIVRGYRVDSVVTNVNFTYGMPSGAVVAGNWHKRGTYGEWMRLDLDGFAFPLGNDDGVYTAFSVFNDGRIRPSPRDAAHEICAVGVPMLAMQGASRFWTLDGIDGGKILTWENFFLHANTNLPVNAQILLRRDGSFATCSNDVQTVYRRINPHDWDGDGLANGIDGNPLAYDGDFSGPANILPDGANSNAYCTVSLLIEGCDAQVVFCGEGDSNYPDPRFIARAGTTNDVMVLIGKRYEVLSSSPLSCVGVSDPETEIDVHGASHISVQRPVSVLLEEEISTPPLARGVPQSSGEWPVSKRGTVVVEPSGLGGEFFFQSCCPAECSGTSFAYIHDECCKCRGCQVNGWYCYEGFRLSVAAPSCCCFDENGGAGGNIADNPAPTANNPLFAVFSSPFAMYEDPYRNEPDGHLFSRRAQPVYLNVGIYGGEHGGNWTLTIKNEGKLRQKSDPCARSGTIPAGEALSLELEFAAIEPSGSTNDILATVAFSQNFTGSNTTASAALTAVRLELEPNVSLAASTVNRHYFGIAEEVLCKTEPENVPGLSFRAKYGSFDDASRTWTCPVANSAVSGGLSVYAYGNKAYNFLTLVLPPRQIAAERAVGLDFNVPAGTAGGAGMLLDLFVLPKTVSFSKLFLAEVPTETAGPSGYFTNSEFSAVWYHTRAMGAGEWIPVHQGNFWCHDEAKMGDSFPPQNVLEWADGTIIWDIPVAWDLGCSPGTNFPNRIPVVYAQRFDFNESGTLRVSKHGFWAERDADNVKRASEGINIWNPYVPEEQEYE